MTIELSCTGCGKRLRVSDDSAGKQARCPACGQISQIPSQALGQEVTPSLSDNPFGESPAPSAPASDNPYQSPSVPTPPIPRASPSLRYELAPRSTRFFGAILDTLITLAGGIPGGILMFATIENNEEMGAVGMLAALAGMLVVGIINWVMISQSGQSIAKRIMRMRIIVRDTGELPGFVRGVLLRVWLPALINQACNLFSLIDALWIFGDERRCLHDLIAGTVVVLVEYESTPDGYRPLPGHYTPPMNASRRLPDKIAISTCPQCGAPAVPTADGTCAACGSRLP